MVFYYFVTSKASFALAVALTERTDKLGLRRNPRPQAGKAFKTICSFADSMPLLDYVLKIRVMVFRRVFLIAFEKCKE